jgi:predicted amidophosphoribosyltransferase
MNAYNLIHQAFSCCLHCGSFQSSRSLFCLGCEKDLWSRHHGLRTFELGRKGTKGFALFDWYPDEDRKVSKLMMRLKGGKLEGALQYYAEALVSRYARRLPSQTVLVPCPTQNRRAHARAFAQAIGMVLDLPVLDSLQKVGEQSQKGRNKVDRADIEIRNDQNFKQMHVIFIDDIVTTGATALSARNAIGSCLSFQIWCLAHRRPLAAFPHF